MDDRITAFIESLKKHLEGMPQEEIRQAVSYYEEYLFDAREAGKDIIEVLAQWDSPEKIAAMIRTETSIVRAQQNPGLRNYTRVLPNAFRMVTTPFAFLLLTVFVLASYTLVVGFFTIALATFAGAVAFSAGLAYQAFTAESQNTMGILGALGMGLLGSGILLLLSYVFFKLTRLLIRASTGVIRRFMRKPDRPLPQKERVEALRKSGWKRVTSVCLAIALTGLILFSVSGLPVKYFTLFNSMKPREFTLKTVEFDPAQVERVSLVTTNTLIKLVRGTGDKMVVTYEKIDWLDYDLTLQEKQLSFKERSNGRLPLFELAQLHENSLELTVAIPEGVDLQEIRAESYGGFIVIDGLSQNIKAVTQSGKITLNDPHAAGKYNLKARTGAGDLVIDGRNIEKNGERNWSFIRSYIRDQGASDTIELTSARGSIFINH